MKIYFVLILSWFYYFNFINPDFITEKCKKVTDVTDGIRKSSHKWILMIYKDLQVIDTLAFLELFSQKQLD